MGICGGAGLGEEKEDDEEREDEEEEEEEEEEVEEEELRGRQKMRDWGQNLNLEILALRFIRDFGQGTK